MLMMQTLVDCFSLEEIAGGERGWTDKPVQAKMAVRTLFCPVVVRSFQRRGIGKAMMRKSKAAFRPPVTSRK